MLSTTKLKQNDIRRTTTAYALAQMVFAVVVLRVLQNFSATSEACCVDIGEWPGIGEPDLTMSGRFLSGQFKTFI
jgi:hypothetical protein